MQLIHSADAREIVLSLDLHYDLDTAGLLLDTYDPDLTDDELAEREQENERRVEEFTERYLKSLAEVAAEEHVSVYVGDVSEATSTIIIAYGHEDTLERQIWQAAHDRVFN